MEKHIFKKEGGDWLDAVHNWIQDNCINGDSVTWGSNDGLGHFTVKELEDVAGEAAYATIKPLCDIEEGLREIFIMQISGDKNVAEVLKKMDKEIKRVSKVFSVDLSE
jgi:hypothetical protein